MGGILLSPAAVWDGLPAGSGAELQPATKTFWIIFSCENTSHYQQNDTFVRVVRRVPVHFPDAPVESPSMLV